MHLSRQQRSGWKQNHTHGGTCSWANPLATDQSERKSDVGVQPPQNFLIVAVAFWRGDLSKSFKPEPLRSFCALRRAVNRLFLSQTETRQHFQRKGKKKKKKLTWSSVASLTRLLSVDTGTRSRASFLTAVSAPARQQIQLCAALPPGAALCYVPWLARMLKGNPCSPQRSSYQLLVLGFTSYRLVTSRIDVRLVFIDALCLVWLLDEPNRTVIPRSAGWGACSGPSTHMCLLIDVDGKIAKEGKQERPL